MKHGSLISPDESAFGFGSSKAVSVMPSATHGGDADVITVPDAHLLFSGDFKRAGNDLKITGDDGKSFVVTDYFKNDKHPSLRSPEGAMLDSDLVEMLAGPLAPGQYAQAGTSQPGAAEAVGRVAVVTGNVTVIRNGVAITVNAGDVILKNDVVQTGAGSTIGLALNDGSTFNLTANARLAINEFVYDPNGTANSSLTTLIQGAATFVAGQVAKSGDMKVATPVATMGIRGTAVILDINALDGRVSISVVDERDNKQHNVEVFDRAGNLIATATSIGGRLFLTPTATLEVIASFTNKTPDMVAAEFAAFQGVLSSYDAAKQFFPNLPDRADVNPKGIQTAEGTTIQPSGGGSKTLPDPIPGDKVVVTEVVITKPVDSSGSVPRDHAPDSGPVVLGPEVTLAQFTVINGTPFDDLLFGTPGNDRVLGFGGNDIIIAGHGGGDDYYDGGTNGEIGDTIKFESTTLGVTIDLNVVNGVLTATADGDEIGHDNIVNVENFVGGDGNDVFMLHTDTHWTLDGGDGIDIIRLAGDLNIRHENGPDVENFEIVDLTAGAHIVDFDADGIADMNSVHTIRVLGNSDDLINVMDHFDGHPNGHWEFIGSVNDLEAFGTADHFSDDITFNQYRYFDGSQLLATAYVQDTITVDANDGPDAGDVALKVNALGNGGFESALDFDGWKIDLDTSDTSSTDSSTAEVDRSGEIIQDDDAVAVLSFSAWVPQPGGTGYGPSITSDAFFGYEGDTVRFVWQLSSGGDWATGFGYIVDANTDEIVQVIFNYQTPFTGSTGIRTTEIALDHSGEFEIVFRVGSYDWTHGQFIGAELDLGYAGILHTGVSEDSSVTFDDDSLLANSTDPDDDDLTLSTVSATSALGAVVTLNENGSVTYDPTAAVNIQSLAAGETATDTFTFTISDGNGAFDTATATVTVLGVNDAPVANHDAFAPPPGGGWSYNAENGHYYKVVAGAFSFGVALPAAEAAGGYLATITDADENAFVANLVGGVGAAWIGGSDDGAEGTFTWRTGPEIGQALPSIFWRIGEPNDGNSALVSENNVYVDNVGGWNDYWKSDIGYVIEYGGRPQDKYAVDEDGTLVVAAQRGVLANDTDIDTASSNLSAVLVEGPAHAQSFTLNADGSFSYTPHANHNGADSFTYQTGDGDLNSEIVTVDLAVNAINDAPVIHTENLYTQENSETDSTTVLGLSVTDVDAGGDDLLVTIEAGHGTITVGADTGVSFEGSLSAISAILQQGATYTPGLPEPATDMVTLTVDDQSGGTDIVNFIFSQGAIGGVTLTGTAEKDIIFTSDQTDTLRGGLSADTFVFHPDMGQDVIADFVPGVDKLMLNGFSGPLPEDFSIWARDHIAPNGTTDTLITLNDCDDTILLQGVLPGQLTSVDFISHPFTV